MASPRLRVVTWNCNRGPLAPKLAMFDTLGADIAVLQECPKPATQSRQFLWFGDNPRQGIGVRVRGEYQLRRLRAHPESPRYVAPVSVTGPRDFSLLAIWAMPDRPHRYVRAVVRAVSLYRRRLARGSTLLIGDLNSNAIWDAEHPATTNHSALVTQLSAIGMRSCYHEHFSEAHGAERTPTFCLYRKAERPYHLDYCFAPDAWLARLQAVTVGHHDTWIKHSDHLPLILDFA